MKNSAATTDGLPDVNATAAERLHQAVRAAGGNQAVAERSGVPLATVNNYVRGRHGMKIEPLAALAAACDVPLAWLVSGGSRPAPGFATDTSEPPPGFADAGAAAPPVAPLGIDVASLAKAIEIVRAVTGNAALDDEAKVLARRIASAYAVLTQPPNATD